MLGEKDRAATDYEAAIRLDLGHTVAFLRRGWLRLHLGQLEGAIEDFRTAIRLDPNDPDPILHWMQCLRDTNRTAKSLITVHEAQRACEQTGGKSPVALVRLALALAESGSVAEAMRQIDSALKASWFATLYGEEIMRFRVASFSTYYRNEVRR